MEGTKAGSLFETLRAKLYLSRMTETPALFDHNALALHRQRAHEDALFLHQLALDEVQDRLELVNRSFKSIGIVSPFAQIWQSAFPQAQIIPDQDVLEFEQDAFDLVIHAMCLHWANDPVGQIIQSRRALKKDGLFLGLMLGGKTLQELRVALAEAEIEVSGGLSPRIAPMAEIRDMGGLLQRSGLNLPVVDGFDMTAEYRNMAHLMQDLRAMGETNAIAQRLKHVSRRAVFLRAEDIYRSHFPTPTGSGITATFEVLCLTGWVPDESQPKPLRPGSASQRLADALGTRETSLRD